MPSRTRHSASAATEVAEPDDQSADLRRLNFNEPISWRVGRAAIPIGDLLQRLQTLAHELRKLEQEEVEKDSLTKVSQELATAQLLAHKDKGVRAWTACCIVDVLRLCAPDAPFTGNQLKDIFTCIVTSIIPALGDPSNTYNAQHIYVLNSLAEVKSIVLMTDLDQPDSLIVPLFTTCFDIVSGSAKASTGEEIAKNVEFDMTRLLVTVIDETPVLAPEVVDVIVAQFLRIDPRAFENPKKSKKGDAPVDAKQGTLLLKDYPPAYNMAKAICQACPERMTSHISQYFNNVIIDASATSKAGSNGASKHRKPNLDDSDEEGEDIKELSKAHRLIRELWRACPEVLQNVVPQLEAELSAESVSLRLLATQTIGDIAAGIGVAGPPPPPPMDPAAYPPVTLADYARIASQPNLLLTPFSPKPFSQAHASTYESFLSRRLDKSASIRAAWVTVAGRIILTSAGGSGLSDNEEQLLIKSLASMLRDADEKVRVAAVDAVGSFGLTHIVYKLGATGGVSTEDSVLFILAERVKDRKSQVREHAMKTLARTWAVAAGEIEEENEQVAPLLRDGPSKIFDAFYTNDPDIHVSIDRALFEILLPLSYPPIKAKLTRSGSSQSQKNKDSQTSEGGDAEVDADRIRVQRILTLLRGLDDKAKMVFFAMQARQMSMRTAMTIYLQACEDYNGGVMEKDEKQIKAQLTKVIDTLSKIFPDAQRTSADLWKFAKVHDRRSYQLIRFSMAAVSDYRTVVKAIKELGRRLQSGNNTPLLDSLMPLLYRCSSLVFNRSHIPAIISLSRTGEHGLANPAHEMLREISSRNPEVLEAQVQEMCNDLESQAPKASTPGASGAEEILKACSGFAKKLPSKLPKERKFFQALVDYALHSPSPRAAKHAVTILMATADKREMYAKDLVSKCVSKWNYGSDRFLTKLATLSQLNLLAPKEVDEESDAIISIAINQILLTNRSPQPDAGYVWTDAVDDETAAKEWALKIIVNRLRAKGGSDGEADFRAHAEPVYDTLNKLVANEGELSKKKDTPAGQKSRLRLLAANSLLKLCASSTLCDQLLTPQNFNAIAVLVQDPLSHVRAGFVNQLKKKLAQKNHLSYRWYTIVFLLAFEPESSLKESTLTWLRSRAAFFSQSQQSGSKKSDPVMESIFSRLLSLLAYHPDYPPATLDEETKLADLTDFARYILFYLSAVANEHNLSLIFHVAQRVKQARDGITKSDEITTRLHTLSDLAQSTIRRFADIYSQQRRFGGSGAGGASILQTYPGKMGIPSSIFAPMSSHREAQDVADKNFLPEDTDELLDRLVRSVMRSNKSGTTSGSVKKRKPEASSETARGDTSASKKARTENKEKSSRPRKSSSSATRTTPAKKKGKKDEDDWSDDGDGGAGKKKASSSAAAQRRSSRGTTRRISYADRDSDEDDMEMDEWEQDRGEGGEDEGEEDEGDDNEMDQSEDGEPANEDADEDESKKSEVGDSDGDSELSPPPPSPKGEKEKGADTKGKRSEKTSSTSTSKSTSKAKSKSAPKEESTTTTLPSRRSSRRG